MEFRFCPMKGQFYSILFNSGTVGSIMIINEYEWSIWTNPLTWDGKWPANYGETNGDDSLVASLSSASLDPWRRGAAGVAMRWQSADCVSTWHLSSISVGKIFSSLIYQWFYTIYYYTDLNCLSFEQSMWTWIAQNWYQEPQLAAFRSIFGR